LKHCIPSWEVKCSPPFFGFSIFASLQLVSWKLCEAQLLVGIIISFFASKQTFENNLFYT
jgi:hypothetical protein